MATVNNPIVGVDTLIARRMRRATRGTFDRGKSRFAIRREEIIDPAHQKMEEEPRMGNSNPCLSIEDLIGSGEFESKRSLNGDLRVAMNAIKGSQRMFRMTAAFVNQGQGCNEYLRDR